jgi:hypothetical protein
VPVDKELNRLLPSQVQLVGAALRGLQSPPNCVLAEKDVRAILEVLVHERCREGVECCRNWPQAELRDKCTGSTVSVVGVSSSPGIFSGSPYTSSAIDVCRSILNAVVRRGDPGEGPLSNAGPHGT